jgi:uncharacterized membrane protein
MFLPLLVFRESITEGKLCAVLVIGSNMVMEAVARLRAQRIIASRMETI